MKLADPGLQQIMQEREPEGYYYNTTRTEWPLLTSADEDSY